MTAESGSIDLSIVIVNWNGRSFLTRCLQSLQAACAGVSTETWLVDNGSNDGSLDLVRKEFPDVCLIANASNAGFARANNQAAERVRGRYLLLLNPDTWSPPGALADLVRFMDEHEEAAAAGPQLLNPDGTRQRSCWKEYPGLRMALSDALYLWKVPWLPLAQGTEYRADELKQARPVAHLLGACMLIRRSMWEQIGPLDQSYFIFLEETDWCRRARAAGYSVLFNPHIQITHWGQESVRQMPAENLPHYYRSYCHFYRKQRGNPPGGVLILKGLIALAAILRIAIWSGRNRRAANPAEHHLAQSMSAGYRRVLTELPSL